MLDELLRAHTDGTRTDRVRRKIKPTPIAPIKRSGDPAGKVNVRYSASPVLGWVRLVLGMVRSNRPTRLIFGLSSALAAALATSAFGLSSSTIWQLSDRLGTPRRLLAALVSVALLVFWLIAAHKLWERWKSRNAGFRRLAVLYNTSTILTLLLGVACLYVGLFLVNLGVAAFLVPSSLLASMVKHPVDVSSYVALAWGFTTMGMIAGAMGSSLESDQAVRQAAYGYREQRRRAEYGSHESNRESSS